MNILGLSAYYHDSAACLVRDGEIVAAAQEERFSRKKFDAEFPKRSVEFCLAEGGLSIDDVDFVGYYEKPLVKFERLLETYVAFAPKGYESFSKALPQWLGKKLWLPREMDRQLGGTKKRRYVFARHHESHAASAFFPSPFEEAAIVTLDGVGEWSTATYGKGEGNRVSVLKEIRFPHSLGLLYSAFTYYTGFEVNAGEYKLMGLAPYGKPKYRDLILRHLIDVKEDGSFWMDQSYFDYAAGLTMTSAKFHELFGGPPKQDEEPITERHMDLAASIQSVTEEVMLKIARHVRKATGSKNLCLSGGVALNCVANGRIRREVDFENVWIQPAAGDAGSAIGAALLIWHQALGNPRTTKPDDAQKGSLLGPEFSEAQVKGFLQGTRSHWEWLPDEALVDRTAELMSQGKVIGWFQGRSEYGPRALGSRSILGDARNPDMQRVMNLKIKFRESFRPFAPAVLRERVADYFGMEPNESSPYMLLVAPVAEKQRLALDDSQKALQGIDLLNAPRSTIPSVTHVDGSARVQTVDERHGRFRRLLERFDAKTGSPVAVNTSFNLSWEPIVNQPAEAYRTFMSSDLDALVVENAVLEKAKQPANVKARRANGSGGEIDPGLAEAWRCPACGGALEATPSGSRCLGCAKAFPKTDGIHQLYWPHDGAGEGSDVTELVKSFYEDNPFPNYDEHESLRSLISKSRSGLYAKLLGEQLPDNADVLEVGCGTGQLTNFLGISCRSVTGADLCLNSLRLAESFRREHELQRVRFLQMNLFRPPFAPESFDVVLCNGVLHHTSDPYGGFRSIAKLLRPGGLMVIGLYNQYGRLLLDARRKVFDLTGGRFRWLDPHLRKQKMSAAKQRAWFADQYQHPHESKHTLGESLRWFEEQGIDFVHSVPSMDPWAGFDEDEDLLRPVAPGSAWDRALTQAKMVWTGSREGGFYIMIGRKRA